LGGKKGGEAKRKLLVSKVKGASREKEKRPPKKTVLRGEACKRTKGVVQDGTRKKSCGVVELVGCLGLGALDKVKRSTRPIFLLAKA